jgi:hypothetical protein
MMDTKSGDPATPGSGVQGWSYGVDHDDAFLTLTSVTVDGTEAAKAKELGGFIVADMKAIQTCKGEPGPGCKSPQAGTGSITAIILSFTQAASLDIKRNPILKAKYTLAKDPGTAGTLIDITDRLKKTGSPPADVNITVNGIFFKNWSYSWQEGLGLAPVILAKTVEWQPAAIVKPSRTEVTLPGMVAVIAAGGALAAIVGWFAWRQTRRPTVPTGYRDVVISLPTESSEAER